MAKRVLIVEDDGALSRVLCDNLVFEGFEVRCVADGDAAPGAAKEFAPDLVILDVMLPGRDGFELVGTLREGGRTPIIMLTARSQKADKLKGLNLGADDYVTKPFDLEELLARVQAVLRRASPGVERLTLGDVVVDFVARQATRLRPRPSTHAPGVRAASVPGRAAGARRQPRRTAARGLGLPGSCRTPGRSITPSRACAGRSSPDRARRASSTRFTETAIS